MSHLPKLSMRYKCVINEFNLLKNIRWETAAQKLIFSQTFANCKQTCYRILWTVRSLWGSVIRFRRQCGRLTLSARSFSIGALASLLPYPTPCMLFQALLSSLCTTSSSVKELKEKIWNAVLLCERIKVWKLNFVVYFIFLCAVKMPKFALILRRLEGK